MISPDEFIVQLLKQGIDFYTGVPDSLLKHLCRAISSAEKPTQHITACNEGTAMGIAIGYYLATNKTPAIYLQNSGLGNLINPYCSLSDIHVYSIPALLIIGWRCELSDNGQQIHDEPQHVKQGKVTLSLLETLDIPYLVMDAEQQGPQDAIVALLEKAQREKRPVALVCRKNTFSAVENTSPAPFTPLSGDMTREEIVAHCLKKLPADAPIVSTTGMLSRELYELREQQQSGHARDFLTVGGMGHASQIALGIALASPKRRVVCLDGDGALLMHMGGLTNTAQRDNLLHIVVNNGVYDSVGGQPTMAMHLCLSDIARAAGYRYAQTVRTPQQLHDSLTAALSQPQSAFIEVLSRPGNRADLGRPKRSPIENKTEFMAFLQERRA